MSNPYIDYASPIIKDCLISNAMCISPAGFTQKGIDVACLSSIIDFEIYPQVNLITFIVDNICDLKHLEKVYSAQIDAGYFTFELN